MALLVFVPSLVVKCTDSSWTFKVDDIFLLEVRCNAKCATGPITLKRPQDVPAEYQMTASSTSISPAGSGWPTMVGCSCSAAMQEGPRERGDSARGWPRSNKSVRLPGWAQPGRPPALYFGVPDNDEQPGAIQEGRASIGQRRG